MFSVFPAPDSPDTMMDWLIFSTFMSRYALSAGVERYKGKVKEGDSKQKVFFKSIINFKYIFYDIKYSPIA